MTEDLLYAQIKERFAFDLPAEYRAMRKRGLMTLELPAGPEVNNSTVPGDGYLYLYDMEWYSLEQIASFKFRGPCQLLPLVPFAFTGTGDYWCWQVDASDQHGTRVLFCPHDYELATIHAPNFAAALYRQALWYVSLIVDGQHISFAQGQAELRRWSVDLAVALPSAWCQVLAELAERTPYAWSHCWGRATQKQTSFLSPAERKQIETRDLQFEEMDAEFCWMRPRGTE